MTTQDLMNLPYAGMAEKELRRIGLWKLTPQEKFDRAMSGIENSIDDLKYHVDSADSAFSQMEQNQ